MTPTADSRDLAQAQILQLWESQLEAMDSGDTQELAACFTSNMTLTHMTGFRQPLSDWLDGIRRRHFVYHRLEEHSVTVVDLEAKRATLVGHITTGITDDGSGHAWRLRMEQDYVRQGGNWLCSASRVSLG